MSSRVNRWAFNHVPGVAVACGTLACVVPLMTAVYLTLGGSSGGSIFGVFAFAIVVMIAAVVVGRAWVMAIAMALFGVASLEATAALGRLHRPAALLISGAALFLAFWLFELSVMFRRSPTIGRPAWKLAVVVPVAIVTVAAVASVVAYVIAVQTTWPALVLPVCLLVLGLAGKFGSDRAAAVRAVR